MPDLRQVMMGLLCLAAGGLARAGTTAELAAALPPAASGTVSFSRDIKPIFDASCVQCHGRGRSKGGLQLETRQTLLRGGDSGAAIVLRQSADSLLVRLVAGLDPERVMPQKGRRLTSEQIGLLRAWIDQGAAWESSITFAKPPPINLLPRSPALKVSAESGVNPIDQILERYFQTHHFRPPAVVGDRVFARRVYLDVVGLLPPAEAAGAITDDPLARERLVRRLLADNEDYAENWLSFWDDLLRNDYRGTGYIDGGRKSITAWLYSALVNNMPYNQFVGQLICPTAPSAGFTKGIVWRGVVNASQSPHMQAAQNIAQVFMGVNLKCASCHDSFINDWRLSDSYGLAAIYADGPLEEFRCDKPTGAFAAARFIYPELGGLDPGADKPARLHRLAEIITGRPDGRLARTIVNRLWARCFGRGLVEPVDDMEQPAWDPDLLDWLAEDLVAHHYDLKHTLEVMLTSRAYQLPAVDVGETASKDYAFQGPAVRRLTAEQFRDAMGQVTGVWYRKAEFHTPSAEVRAGLVAADPLAVALGRPNREQVVTGRASNATTLQALELENGQTLAYVLETAAFRLAEPGPRRDELIERLFHRALERDPTEAERDLADGLVGQPVKREGVEDLLWALAMLPEFQLIY